MGRYALNRLELAGSVGDLGTLLPLAMGMIMVNGLDPVAVFFSVGLFYILSALYFGVPVAVQPMKVIAAYAIASGASATQVAASGWLLGAMLLALGLSGLVDRVSRLIPHCVVRGVQLSTGVLLIAKGASFIAGKSSFQQAQGLCEPFLAVQNLGLFPVSVVLGILLGIVALVFLNSKKNPAGLLILAMGTTAGLLLGGGSSIPDIRIGLYLPQVLPFGLASKLDFTWALLALALALPQIPMTLGNAVIANRHLSAEYFGSHSKRVTDRALCISMGVANILVALLGAMPLCHGAGGLAAHYRFGARTAGSSVFIGAVFLVASLVLGSGIVLALHLIPFAALGVLLIFAGVQLGLTLLDITQRSDLFVVVCMCGVALGTNLGWAFGLGIGLALLLRAGKVQV